MAKICGWICGALLAAGGPLDGAPMVSAQSLPVPQEGRAGFTLMSPMRTGVTFTNALPQSRHLTNQILLNGSGVAAGDVNGDGWCDLYFCALDKPNALYLNRGGWRFDEVAQSAGVACAGQDSTGAVMADLDGDGDLDLLVSSLGSGLRVFFNDGAGRFFEPDRRSPLNPRLGGMSMALADIDGDGDLDLYVANYRTETLRDQPKTQFNIQLVEGQPVVTGINGVPLTDPGLTNRFEFRISMQEGRGGFSHLENGEPDVLFRNDGQGRFEPVPFTGGMFLDREGEPLTGAPLDWGLSVMFRDLNRDGRPDLYVCNDFESPDRVWIQDAKGRFRPLPLDAMPMVSLSSMGVDVADLDRDGWDEIFTVDMLSPNHERRHGQRMPSLPEAKARGEEDAPGQYSRNMLHWNRGDGTYAEIAFYAGLAATEWSWTPVFLDVDLDGWEDLLVVNGFARDNMHVDTLRTLQQLKKERSLSAFEQLQLRSRFPELRTPNQAYRNQGDRTFAEAGKAWGFDLERISQGMALADLDNDGDLDVVTCDLNDPAGLYRNESAAPRVAIRLQGRAPNTQAIGARLHVLGGPVEQSQEIVCGGRYLSGDETLRVFAAGERPMTLEVRWRDGQTTRLTNLLANHRYVVTQPGQGERKAEEANAVSDRSKEDLDSTWFEDVSDRLGHRHAEVDHDDLAWQPSLPHRLSQPGPGVAWFDINADGRDDLLIAGGQGSRMGAYVQTESHRFEPVTHLFGPADLPRDQTAVMGWAQAQARIVAAGMSNYEDGQPTGSVAVAVAVAGKWDLPPLPPPEGATGPMSLADVDGDGDLDWFVGTRAIQHRYPVAATSRLFRQENGVWLEDEEEDEVLRRIGLVQGSVFSDLDADGDPDLVLSCHAGPIRILENRGGRLVDATESWGMGAYRGWWTGVATGDFNGDGRPDVVAGNWGRNTPYESHRQTPLLLYATDLDENGVTEAILGYRDLESGRLLPWQSWSVAVQGLPWLGALYPSWDAYGEATLEELYQGALRGVVPVEFQWMESTLFLNLGGRFEAHPLPWPAQIAPVFGVAVADANGDGWEDVFLSQNFLATAAEDAPYQAGRGLWLLGDGQGGMRAWPAKESGVRMAGGQRGAAVGDFDGDGRVDLAVGQNQGETRLYRNRGSRTGLRVRLRGGEMNPAGVGAMIRVRDGVGRWGPAREVQVGSGYCSQDSAVEVFFFWGEQRGEGTIWVRWPGGGETEHRIMLNEQGEAKTMVLGMDGSTSW